jgi:hypothetical protein
MTIVIIERVEHCDGQIPCQNPGSRQSTTRMADLHVHVILQECVIEVVRHRK